MTHALTPARATLWTAIVAATALVGSYGFACVFPFVAVATIAALTLPLGRALALTALVWGANQFVGYAFMDFPRVFDTYALGVSLGLGALLACGIAARIAGDAKLFSARAVIALAIGFVGFEALQYAAAFRFGGLASFTAPITFGIALNDLGWFLLLGGLRHALALRERTAARAVVAA